MTILTIKEHDSLLVWLKMHWGGLSITFIDGSDSSGWCGDGGGGSGGGGNGNGGNRDGECIVGDMAVRVHKWVV